MSLEPYRICHVYIAASDLAEQGDRQRYLENQAFTVAGWDVDSRGGSIAGRPDNDRALSGERVVPV